MTLTSLISSRKAGRRAVDALPEMVLVGPFEIAIERMDPHRASSENAFGQFRCNEQMISIQEDMPTAVKAIDTLLHEIGHAIYWAYNLDDNDKQERIVATTATAWTQIYRDNPWLLSWIGAIFRGESFS